MTHPTVRRQNHNFTLAILAMLVEWHDEPWQVVAAMLVLATAFWNSFAGAVVGATVTLLITPLRSRASAGGLAEARAP